MFLFSLCLIGLFDIDHPSTDINPSCQDGGATAQLSQLGNGGGICWMLVIFGSSMDKNNSKFLSPDTTYP